jgi:hypothetical protein
MNYAELAFSSVNTLLLVILFLYQRNRNKVLEDQLSAQRQLLDETKNVVTQQATAIDGQSKVVDTALKYTAAFDLKKLEDLLRREIAIEQKEEVSHLRKELEAKSNDQEAQNAKVMALITRLTEIATDVAAHVTQEMVVPLVPFAVQVIAQLPPEERVAAAATIKPESLRVGLLEAVSAYEKQNAIGVQK